MSNIKENLRRARLGAIGFVVGAAGMTGLLSLGGLVVHGFGYLDDATLGDDYSLRHRFESAYCINVPESHKYYTTYYYDGTNDEKVSKQERYMVSPWFTYPVIVGYGALSAAILGAGVGGCRPKQSNVRGRVR